MKNLLFVLFGLLLVVGCGNDDEDNNGMNEDECSGSLTALVDGQSSNYGAPEQAFLVENNVVGGSELGVIWVANGININLQLVVDLAGADCVESKRYDLLDLPSDVSIFSIQYTNIASNQIATVSNVFLEDGDTGFIEVSNCDGVGETVDISFGLTSTTLAGDAISFSGVAEDICFERSK